MGKADMTHYERAAQEKLDAIRQKERVRILAIETSCDETAAAVVENGRTVLSNAVHTQIPLHVPFGGVVPEIASRSHVQKIGSVVRLALDQANLTLGELDAIAVTNGPGLVGALLVGLSYAKGLAYASGLPFLGVHHIASHIAANYLTYPTLEPPFTCLVASGGHSHIILVEDYDRYRLIGHTRTTRRARRLTKSPACWGLATPAGQTLKRSRAKATRPAIASVPRLTKGTGSILAFPASRPPW